MYGYILTAIAMILIIILLAVFLLSPSGSKAPKDERSGKKGGLVRTKPSAEQIQPADEQVSVAKEKE